uniref:Uncharacterized protein n=1 Tax=Picea glauca TaxID=3330 RepID=A0A101LWU6_PICGL|nr:hypothetical protein ABT39_MTgene6269 [Picea glauca]QHR87896.1 hypothetical protein Q903MT_gene1908 [Picea sitchensis]
MRIRDMRGTTEEDRASFLILSLYLETLLANMRKRNLSSGRSLQACLIKQMNTASSTYHCLMKQWHKEINHA